MRSLRSAKRGFLTVAVCFINSLCQPGARAADAGDPRRGTAGRDRLHFRARCCPRSSSTTLLDDRHQRRPLATRRRLRAPTRRTGSSEQRQRWRPAAAPFGRWRMTPQDRAAFRGTPGCVGNRRGRDRGRHLSALCGFENAIGLDMGGTSTDISLVYQGEARVTKEWFVEYGYPICFPSIEVLTIGAGGGSICWIDDAGSLATARNRQAPIRGRRATGVATIRRRTRTRTSCSAGSAQVSSTGRCTSTGPPPSGRSEHVGTRSGSMLVGGRGSAPPGGEREHGRRRAADLDSAGVRPARVLPRRFRRSRAAPRRRAGGGVAIPTVLVPPSPGITSALGCLLVDVRHDLSAMFLARVDSVDRDALSRRVRPAGGRGTRAPRGRGRSGGADVAPAPRRHALPRPVALDDDSRRLPGRPRGGRRARFHAEHEREYNYRRDGAPVEIYRLNVRAVGVTPKPQLKRHEPTTSAPEPRSRGPFTSTRPGRRRHAVLPPRRPDGRRGARRAGGDRPARLDDARPAGLAAEVDEWLNIRMDQEET